MGSTSNVWIQRCFLEEPEPKCLLTGPTPSASYLLELMNLAAQYITPSVRFLELEQAEF